MPRILNPLRWTTALLFSVLVLGQASAIYVETPLALEASDREADVGDVLVFQVQAREDAGPYAGATVRVIYTFDANESGEGPDAPTDSSSFQERVLLEELVLGDKAEATFEWTVPAEVDARNVDIVILSEDDERLAFEYVAIGDAPAQMRIMAGSGPAGEPEPYTGEADDGAANDSAANDDAEDAKPVPGAGAAAALALIGAVALLRRK